MDRGPCTLAFRASQTFAYREREPTERVNIVRELRKGSFEERERGERAGEKKKRVVKEKRERKNEEQRKRKK